MFMAPYRIALLGTGLMGAPMAQRLLETGHRVSVWNRGPEKAIVLAAAGAQVAADPAAAVADAEAVVLTLGDAVAIRAVLLAEPVRARLPGKTVIQMGTIGPRESQALAQAVDAAGGSYLECPVLGSIPEARAGTLILMMGGSEGQLERWGPLLQTFGPQIRRVGPVGTAAALKLALNQLIAALTTAYGLAIGFAEREGVPLETLAEVVRESALYAPTFDKKLQRMLERDYDRPNFPTRHLLKDVRLFLDEAQGLDLEVDALAGIERILTRAIDQGLGNADYSALFEAVCPKR
jgi:3-hydroxyisobutyrate dehydrogenase